MSSEKKPSITPTPDGPYMVEGLNNFANQKGPIEAPGRRADYFYCPQRALCCFRLP